MTTSILAEYKGAPQPARAGQDPCPTPPSRRVTLIVCTTCRRAGQEEGEVPAGRVLAETLAAHVAACAETHPAAPPSALLAADAPPITIRSAQCLANCRRGPSVALARAGAWTYLFGDLPKPDTAAAALLQGATLFADSADGLMPWRGRPEPLKRGLIARIPPLDQA